MKIWPFDKAGLENKGNFITNDQIKESLEPLDKIRKSVGNKMEIMMEFHGLWNLPTAIKIAKAVEPYNITWLEEMLPQDNLNAYKQLKRNVSIPLNISERLMGKWAFNDLMRKNCVDYVMFDISWCGGITEGKKIATLAHSNMLPVCPHNVSGPFTHLANLHLAASIPNLFILESTAYY